MTYQIQCQILNIVVSIPTSRCGMSSTGDNSNDKVHCATQSLTVSLMTLLGRAT